MHGCDSANGERIRCLDVRTAGAHLQGQRVDRHAERLAGTAHALVGGGADQQTQRRHVYTGTAAIEQLATDVEHHITSAGHQLLQPQVHISIQMNALGGAEHHAAGNADAARAVQLQAAIDGDVFVQQQVAGRRPAKVARAAQTGLRPVGDGAQRGAGQAHPVHRHRWGAAQAGSAEGLNVQTTLTHLG